MRMMTAYLRRQSNRRVCLRMAWSGVCILASLIYAVAQEPDRTEFASPQEAAQAFADACAADDVGRLLAMLGPNGRDLVSSGDEVADKAARARLARAYQDMNKLVPEGENKQILHVGTEDWALPIPIVKRPGGWQFATLQGKDELLRRRISSNEASAVRICGIYVQLQQQYAARLHDDTTRDGSYADKFRSDPGKHNGLYWTADGNGRGGPANTLFDLAAQEGYSLTGSHPKPVHGYYFRILTAQGPDAPGGEKSYYSQDDVGILTPKKMNGGFALVAYPAKYQASGVMTFIVNQDGMVYQKDLGDDTVNLASQMTAYNPDSSWAPVP